MFHLPVPSHRECRSIVYFSKLYPSCLSRVRRRIPSYAHSTIGVGQQCKIHKRYYPSLARVNIRYAYRYITRSVKKWALLAGQNKRTRKIDKRSSFVRSIQNRFVYYYYHDSARAGLLQNIKERKKMKKEASDIRNGFSAVV